MASPSDKPPLIQYWHEPEPPDYIAELLATFAAMNPHMEHMVFDEASAEEFIAEHYGEREVAAFRACGVPAMQADYLRYCAGYALGGVWADADMRCLKPLPLLEDGAGMQVFRAGAYVTNEVFLAASPGQLLLELARQGTTKLIEDRFVGTVADVTGPAIFTILFWMSQVQPVDALLRYFEEGVLPGPDHLRQPAGLGDLEGLAPSSRRAAVVRAMRDVADDDRLFAGAFAGVRVTSLADAPAGVLASPERPMSYKDSKTHWPSAGTAIYRKAPAGRRDKPPLIQYWHEPEPPDYIAELIATFAAMNPEMEHMVFHRESAAEFIAEHHGEREVDAFGACALPAMQADYFRYCAGHALGGLCVDADCRCVAPLLSMFELPEAGVLCTARPAVVANGVFWFRSPGAALLDIAREIATELIGRRFQADAAVVTGPGLFTCLYCLRRFGSLQAALRFAEEDAAKGVESSRGEEGDPDVLQQLTDLLGSGPEATREVVQTACTVLGDDARLREAFEDVRVVTGTELGPYRILHADRDDMHYKSTDVHWSSGALAMYRDASGSPDEPVLRCD